MWHRNIIRNHSLLCVALLEEDIQPDESEAVTMVKHVYRSCLDRSKTQTKKIGPSFLMYESTLSFGGWGAGVGGGGLAKYFARSRLLIMSAHLLNTVHSRSN